jgi:hypothetical protein
MTATFAQGAVEVPCLARNRYLDRGRGTCWRVFHEYVGCSFFVESCCIVLLRAVLLQLGALSSWLSSIICWVVFFHLDSIWWFCACSCRYCWLWWGGCRSVCGLKNLVIRGCWSMKVAWRCRDAFTRSSHRRLLAELWVVAVRMFADRICRHLAVCQARRGDAWFSDQFEIGRREALTLFTPWSALLRPAQISFVRL